MRGDEEVATQEVSFEPGQAAISPARFPEWTRPGRFAEFADEVRERTGGIPIGFKLSAQHIESDLDAALEVGVDYVILDGRGGGTGTRDVRVSLSESPSRVWLDAEARLQGVSAGLEGSWSGIISRIRPPVGFAAIDVDGESVAAGFAVRDDDWFGLFEINVAASHRRRGLGGAISSALLDWGADGGAKRAYL